MATKLVLEVQVGRRALERLLDGLLSRSERSELSRFVEMVAFEAVSAGRGVSNCAHIILYYD